MPLRDATAVMASLWCFLCFLACWEAVPKQTVDLPARFEGNRIFVDVAAHNGDTLRLFTDTGGGLFVYGHAVDRLGLDDPTEIRLSDLAIDNDFPEPLGSPNRGIPIFRPNEPPDLVTGDGMLGQAWFADRVWTFDYPHKKLQVHSGLIQPNSHGHDARLGFLVDSTGARRFSFPRISLSVAGDSLEMLFDTGASVRLTTAARERLSEESRALRSTSFVTSEVLDRWCALHPKWPVILDSDERVRDMRMVLVPEVSIAGYVVGPVWFTERPNESFHEYMSQWMDHPIDGAVGGNALRFFTVTVDYPAAVARFVRR